MKALLIDGRVDRRSAAAQALTGYGCAVTEATAGGDCQPGGYDVVVSDDVGVLDRAPRARRALFCSLATRSLKSRMKRLDIQVLSRPEELASLFVEERPVEQRRQAGRVAIDRAASAFIAGSFDNLVKRVVDVGRLGVGLALSRPVAVGTRLRVSMRHGRSAPVAWNVEVRWCDGARAGAAFL
jgi:hypothetical protein